jgi:hypothetical protein
MVSMARKIFYCFLLSAIVCAGMVILVFTGIFDPSIFSLSRAATYYVGAAFFLALFLLAFFCFSLLPRLWSRNSANKKKTSVEASDFLSGEEQSAILNYSPEPLFHETDEFEELETTDKFETVVKSETIEKFETVLPALPALNDDTESNDEIFELEEFSDGCDSSAFLFSRPFSFFPGNPEMLQGIAYDMQYDVLYEENGIHYINNNIFDSDYNGKELNDDFAQLVESVVNKT